MSAGTAAEPAAAQTPGWSLSVSPASAAASTSQTLQITLSYTRTTFYLSTDLYFNFSTILSAPGSASGEGSVVITTTGTPSLPSPTYNKPGVTQGQACGSSTQCYIKWGGTYKLNPGDSITATYQVTLPSTVRGYTFQVTDGNGGANTLEDSATLNATAAAATSTPTSSPTVFSTSTPTASPTPTSTPSPTATSPPTATRSATPASTATSTYTAVPSNTPTASATSSATLVPTNTATASPSSTATVTVTPASTSIATATPSYTPTATLSPTSAASATGTSTPTGTATNTATATGTSTSTRTATSIATTTPSYTPTATVTLSPTSTASATGTSTPTGTATGTSTSTPTAIATATPSYTPTATVTLSPTSTASATGTSPPTGTPTGTSTSTPTATSTATATASYTPTVTLSATSTASATGTLTPTGTATNTATATGTSTSTPTGTPTATATPSYTPTRTLSPTSTASATGTLTPTGTATNTATATGTSTSTGTPTATATPSYTPTPTLSATSTASATGTLTPTGTATNTATATGTSTSTLTATLTSTSTSTPSYTPTASPALTSTATNTPAPSATPTATPANTATTTPTSIAAPATAVPLLRDTPAPAGQAAAPSAPVASGSIQQVMPYSPELSAAQLSQDPAAQPLDQTYTVSAAAGSTIVDNTVALSIPAGAAGARSGDTLSVSLQPLGQALALLAQSGVAEQTVGIWPPIPRGLARFSASGTVFGVRVADGNGVAVSAFTAPVTLSIKLKPADLVGANGELSVPTVAYLVEPDTPAMVNPDNFPPGSWVFFPASAISVDVANSVVTVQAQALGDAVAVFNRPPPYVRTLGPAALFSGYDPETSLTFGRRVQPTYLQVIEPQIGDRLLVIELATGGYTYVNAADVAVATGVR